MGRFNYSSQVKAEVEDRALAHLQVVIGNKLRRGESFFFTWRDDATVGDGRRSVWIHPSADLDFKYYGSRAPAMNRTWLEKLAYAANSSGGLFVMSEPPDEPQTGTIESI
ncbi:ATP-dependent DNA ligase [Microbacterium sp. KSW4-11]|uniref:ATP-dependent DNA ligase n=1 Tax=Microbacterium gawkjiense TaxID=3067309 RepID=A0ABU3G7A8_9MICO|nr:ATP-dependent DNA ligase [Microbacterium sp. KSW4-11]MDT3315712.1 ATP-dependent DNA ligase [Microbacterium sp. KSW4-11]